MANIFGVGGGRVADRAVARLGLEPGQAGKALAFAGLGFLLQAGLVLGTTTGDSMFLTRIGATGLPTAYILQTVVMLVHTAATLALVRRYGIDRVFFGALTVMVICGIAVWSAFARWDDALPVAVAYAVKLYADMWFFGLYTLFWSFLDSYFDLSDAKRLYALLAAGSAAGAMAGGAIVSLLASRIGAGEFFLLWAAFAFVSLPALAFVVRRFGRIDMNDDHLSPAANVFREAWSGIASLGTSRYAVVLTCGFFLVFVTATMCEYAYMRVFSEGRSESELAALFGRLTLIASIANMLIALFLFNPLVARFGVRNVVLLQPIAFAAVFLWFVGAAGMGAAVAGFLAYHVLMTSIDINNGNLLVFGLPASRRRELRSFIEGVCLPAAAATTGLFLLIVAPSLPIQQLASIGLAIAVLTLLFNVIVRRDYVAAIAANLRTGWLDLAVVSPHREATAAPLDVASPAAIAAALAGVRGPARAHRIAAVATAAGAAAVRPLLDMAGDFDAAERRLAEQLLVAMGPGVIPALVEAAESPSYTLRARSIALRALGRLDFDRLRALSGPLMHRTARRGFEFFARHEAFRGATDPGAIVLQRIARDYPMLTLEIVLEALTIAGRLPPYEAIAVALQGGASRERGFALEAVEQAAGRSLGRLLTPWFATWPTEKQLAYARDRGLISDLSEADALERAVASTFPLEAAAAGQALWMRGAPDRLRARLHDLPHPILIDTARILAARDAGTDDGTDDGMEATPIECVDALMRVPELAMFNFLHLEWLAPSLRTHAIAAGTVLARPGQAIDRAWVVTAGTLTVRDRDGERQLHPGSIAGLGALAGDRQSVEEIIAGEGLRAIEVFTHDVLECAEVFSELALELLRLRLAAA